MGVGTGLVEDDLALDPAGADARHNDPTRMRDLMARRSSIAR
jgi:hypothetical protein